MPGLSDYRMQAVLRADDFERAKRFYTEVVGLTYKEATGATTEGVFVAGDGAAVMIYERPGMSAPQNTTLGFSVPSDMFDAAMAELRSKGVVFEEYDIPEIGLKTVNGVVDMEGVMGAWFKDTEDNIISVTSM